MSISYPITLPAAPPPAQITVKPVAAVGRAVSPFTFHSQAQISQGQQWRLDVLMPPMKRTAAELWISALISLNGRQGTMKVPIYGAGAPAGSWGGTAQVAGGAQSGAELDIDGLTVSQTGICKAGDYFTLEDRLYKVLVDANSDAGGAATLDIWPALRSAPADNALLTVIGAYGVFYLESTPAFNIDKALNYGFGFTAVESL